MGKRRAGCSEALRRHAQASDERLGYTLRTQGRLACVECVFLRGKVSCEGAGAWACSTRCALLKNELRLGV